MIQVFRSVSSCPYRKGNLFGDKTCNSLWLVNQCATVRRVHRTVENCVTFVFSEDLHDIFLWVLRCFGVFRTISDMFFKASILPTCNFFEQQVSCASNTLSISMAPAALNEYIRYKYWKRLALRNITSLACETKQTVSKLSESRCNPL